MCACRHSLWSLCDGAWKTTHHLSAVGFQILSLAFAFSVVRHLTIPFRRCRCLCPQKQVIHKSARQLVRSSICCSCMSHLTRCMLFDSGLGIACRLKAAAKSPAPAKKSWMEDSPALCAPSHADPDIMNKNAILISVGASAWSEELPDTTFTAWFQKNFSDAREAWPPGLPWRNINQRLVQQNEFVTAAGHRPGLNPLCKPLSALDEDTKLRLGSKQPVGGGVLKLSILQVPWTQDSDAVYMGRKNKFWMVRRMSCVVRITPVLRSNPMRPE